MNEIIEMMDSWKEGDYINPDALKAAYEAVKLLVAKVEALEETINTLTSKE